MAKCIARSRGGGELPSKTLPSKSTVSTSEAVSRLGGGLPGARPGETRIFPRLPNRTLAWPSKLTRPKTCATRKVLASSSLKASMDLIEVAARLQERLKTCQTFSEAVEKGPPASLRSTASLQRTAQVRLHSSVSRAPRIWDLFDQPVNRVFQQSVQQLDKANGLRDRFKPN